ncbi:MAG: hypothetical protein Kow0089_19910 [Desulfobulbaceae bacterium]
MKARKQKKPVMEKYVEGSRRLYLLFGGISAEVGMLPFEFYKSSRIINENKIFFRDYSQAWYQNGLPGVGDDVYEMAEFITRKIEKIQPREIYFVGNSMGGFAAILFAALVGRGVAIAFAPQTFISPLLKMRHLDFRWLRQIVETYRKTMFKPHVWNLSRLVGSSTAPFRADIYVSRRHRLDFIHADRLRGQKSVNIYEFDVGGHDLVKFLRDDGSLPDILLGRYEHTSHPAPPLPA